MNGGDYGHRYRREAVKGNTDRLRESSLRDATRIIAKLESLIHAEDEFALFRIDPIRFADEKKVSEAEAIDLFLHATRLGLFQMDTGNCSARYVEPLLIVSIASTISIRIILPLSRHAAQRLPWTTTCR